MKNWNKKTQFENEKTQFSGYPLAWTGLDRCPKKTLDRSFIHIRISRHYFYFYNCTVLIAPFPLIYTCIFFAVLFFLFTATFDKKSYSHYTSCIFLFHLFALCTNATFSAKSRICHQILSKQFCQRRSVELTVILYLTPLLYHKIPTF